MKARVLGSWVALIVIAPDSHAQWTNRYPKVEGSDHVYLEGYELPVLGAGPSDPAPSPDGKTLAIAARGWIWLMELSTREARRITSGPHMDSRPTWSPDGRSLAFVRDNGRDTAIVLWSAESRAEQVIVDTGAIDLDPAFTSNGRFLYYSSAEAGDLDLWRLELGKGHKVRVTSRRGLELKPLPLPEPDSHRLVYLQKGGDALDAVVLLDTRDGATDVLEQAGIAAQMRPALSPDGRKLALSLPGPRSWQLWLRDLESPSTIQLAAETYLPMTPSWSADGRDVFFVQADEKQRFHVYRAPVAGGDLEDVSPIVWRWGVPLGRVVITTRMAGEEAPVPARLNLVDGDGHPVLPEEGQTRFDSRNGLTYSYSPGVMTVELPLGELRIRAAHGFTAATLTATRTVRAGETQFVELEFSRLWDPASEGWFSADHHFHLDWGGTYRLEPDDLVILLAAEDLDVGTPLAANLDVRVKDLEWWGWNRLGEGSPLILFGQEVRPHFFGHTGFIGIASRFWPTYWGPGYPVYGEADIPKSDAYQHAHEQGGFSFYVHPISDPDPFPRDGSPRGLPLELVPDAVLGDLDALEIVCLWSDALGTSEAWYRLLNLGVNIRPTGGSDALVDWYRSMSVGSSRVYARVEEPFHMSSYLDALKAGRSFVTTGPLLKFVAGGEEPGGVLERVGEIDWALTLWSPTAVDKVEVILNGKSVWSGAGLSAAGEKSYSGRLKAPVGGWIAVRAFGGPTSWPVMDGIPFAHTAPIWLGAVGSRDPDASQRAAQDLLRWMDVADARLTQRFREDSIPRIRERFAAARERLEEFAQ